MKQSMFTRGFTLIELLVVIAIIGILAAVVIGSLNDARSGGQNASIQQSIANVRSQAELVYNAEGYSYTEVCADPRVTNLINAALSVVNSTGGIQTGAASNSTTTPASRVAVCRSNDTQYIAASPLSGGSNFWCVDSTGASKLVSAVNGTTMVCP
jgi:type IV pilus assembly protein PilA